MTIFRSKPATQKIVLSNFRVGGFSVLSEPWAHEFTLRAGERLEIECNPSELQDPNDPLNFEIWDDGSGVSIWCPPSTKFTVIDKDSTA